MTRGLFISGIGTGIGKTVVSAIFTEALGADYWKPVQSGSEPETDAEWVGRMTPQRPVIHPERYCLERPLSPHAAAAAEGVSISLRDFQLPSSPRPIITEGAGGLLVPLNHRDTMLDLAGHLGLPVVLVSRHYLGNINHTLLSLEVLKKRGTPLACLVFIGENPATEEAILSIGGADVVLRLPEAAVVDTAFIQAQAARLGTQIRALIP